MAVSTVSSRLRMALFELPPRRYVGALGMGTPALTVDAMTAALSSAVRDALAGAGSPSLVRNLLAWAEDPRTPLPDGFAAVRLVIEIDVRTGDSSPSGTELDHIAHC